MVYGLKVAHPPPRPRSRQNLSHKDRLRVRTQSEYILGQLWGILLGG